MIELQDISKSFGAFRAVDHVDLSIRAGEFITLLGPSGCGKTTILRMISGFETPTSGKVLLDGLDVTNTPPYRRDVNQVFQSYALFPHLSVRDNIAFGLKMKRVSRAETVARVDEVLGLVSLSGMESRKPAQLSGGQKQRVALARAIVNRPKVLLLDEPLAALDAKLRRSMQVELKHLQSRLKITFLFVTHDQEEALTMSDRIAVMNAGKLEQLGTAREIYHKPRTTFVASFLGHSNLLPATAVGTTRVRLTDSIELQVLPIGSIATSLTISIRPEKIRLESTRPHGENVFEATIIDEIFQGPLTQFMLRAGSGLELTALVANESAPETSFRKGQQVFVQLHRDDLRIV